MKYRVVDWSPENISENQTVGHEIERLLNENGANGWVFDRFEGILANGQRRFYFNMSDELQVVA